MYHRRLVTAIALIAAGLGLLLGSVALVGHASVARTHGLHQDEVLDLYLPLLIQRVDTNTLPTPSTAEPMPTTTSAPTASATSTGHPTHTHTPASSPTATSTATASATLPPTDGYFFIEVYEDHHRGPGCVWRSAESPANYEFFPDTGVLRRTPWGWLPINDRHWLATGCGHAYSGRGGGHSNYIEAFRDFIPLATRDCGIDVIDMSYGGRVTVKRQATGEEYGLGVGDEWSLASLDESNPGCVVTTTYRITNYGWQDRTKIEWYGP